MKRRIIIIGLFRYPRGGAFSNYVQYLSDALVVAGYKVEILSRINKEYSTNKTLEYHGATVREISAISGSHRIHSILNGKLFRLCLGAKITAYKLCDADVVIASNSFQMAVKKVLRLKQRYGFRTVGCALEWFGREQFDCDADALQAERNFRVHEQHNLIFPISHHIADQFPNNKCMVLPIMADANEYPFEEKKSGKYRFIFPSNGLMKDALGEMIRGLAMLDPTELDSTEFHLTGVKQESIKTILSNQQQSKLSKCLVIHDWMVYEELIALYKNVHFMFLARPVNQTTLSNFPSKVPETMTHGVVPVVSKVGDYTSYYLEDGKNSLVFDGYDAVACRNAIRRATKLSFKEYSKLSFGARRCVEEKFDFHNWAYKIRDNIESLF